MNGADVTNNATRVVSSRMNLFVNVDPDETKRSNWAIGEVIVWDRHLSTNMLRYVSAYLLAKVDFLRSEVQ